MKPDSQIFAGNESPITYDEEIGTVVINVGDGVALNLLPRSAIIFANKILEIVADNYVPSKAESIREAEMLKAHMEDQGPHNIN